MSDFSSGSIIIGRLAFHQYYTISLYSLSDSEMRVGVFHTHVSCSQDVSVEGREEPVTLSAVLTTRWRALLRAESKSFDFLCLGPLAPE